MRRSAVGVPQSPGKLTRFPPIVMHVLNLSFLPSQNTLTILVYVSSPILSFGMSSFHYEKDGFRGFGEETYFCSK